MSLSTNDVTLTLERQGAGAIATNTTGLLSFTALIDGTYYVRIQSTNRNLRAQYILDVAVTDAVPPVVTGFTVNNGYTSQVVTQGAVLSLLADRISLSFSEDMLAGSVNDVTNNYDLRAAGADGLFGTGDDETYRLISPNYSTGPGATYQLASGPMQAGAYRITISGLQDRAGNALAAPFVREFAINGVGGFIVEGRSNNAPHQATSLSPAPGSAPIGC